MICGLRQSKIHGRGVFANRDIYIGEKLCIYDGNIKLASSLEDCSYSIDMKNGLCLDGLREPRSELGIAQFINCGLKFEPKGSFIEILDSIYEYISNISSSINAEFKTEKGITYAISIKPIKKDEEVLVDYSPLYWIARGVTEQTEEIIKSHACYIALEKAKVKYLDVRDELKVKKIEGNKYWVGT